MGAPSAHGQKNKAHKGTKGLNARDKHRQTRDGPGGAAGRASAKAASGAGGAAGGKQERMLATKQQRSAKHQELLEKRRRAISSPLVVGLLPLSQDVDVAQVWRALLAACEAGPPAASAGPSHRPSEDSEEGGDDEDMADADGAGPSTSATAAQLRALTVGVAGRPKLRLTLLPPPALRSDPLAVAEYGRAAEVLLLLVPGSDKVAAIDAEGHMALSILRALGLPEAVLGVQGCSGSGSGSSSRGKGVTGAGMKERSAARKRAEKAVGAELSGEQRAHPVDSAADCGQLLRHILDRPAPDLPHWRRQRPALMVEAAEIVPASQQAQQQQQQQGAPTLSANPLCSLMLTGWVRCAGLRVTQLVTIPGAGDFQLERIEGPILAHPAGGRGSSSKGASSSGRGGAGAGGGGARGGRGGGGGDMDMSGSEPQLLAQADEAARDPLVCENIPDEGDEGGGGEQTWPSEAEIADAQRMFQRRQQRHKVPQGTSAYQAAWIMDDASDVEGSEEEGSSGRGDGMEEAGLSDEEGGGGIAPTIRDDDAGTDVMGMDQDDEDQEEGGRWARLQAEARARREAEGEDAEHPDEVEVPQGVSARVRFQKFKGLKSFRSSPWDPKEWLPSEYARIFAFENLHRAHKRAREVAERATSGADPLAVQPGTCVRITVCNVPADKAAEVASRVQASFPAEGSIGAPRGASAVPLVVMGLMTHESKMSVLHMALRKAKDYTSPLPSKEELLLFTGLRSFTSRPVFSSDTPGDKHKMERWLGAGQSAVGSVYAPIAYPPLPVLAFKVDPMGGPAQLVAAGGVRSCDPERIVLKKVVLTGYPVRVHKKRATVKYMFHDPDDVRWFRPVEVYTRTGRRGRITEPIGTHGAMKCIFDGPVQQRDLVCMSLYKRVFPKWPGAA